MFRNKMTIWHAGAVLLTVIVLMAMVGSSAKADFTFGQPVDQTTVIPVLDPNWEIPFCFSADGLEMYILSFRPEATGGCDIWVLRRDSIDADWPPPEHLGPAVNSPNGAYAPYISRDGLELHFGAERPGGYGSMDLYMTTRASRNDPWGEAVNLGPKVNGPSFDAFSCVSPDGLELYFQSNRPGGLGGFDIYVSRRATAKDPWGDPENLGPVVNSEYDDVGLCLSPDGLLLFFQDLGGAVPRPGGYGRGDMWMTRRAGLSSPWGPPVNLGPNVNGPNFQSFPRVSPDGSLLYYCTDTDGVYDNWQAPILPTVDFNADKKVDLVDLVMLIDNWGTNKTVCDIGPMPWGDGKVDIEDLKVFMTYYEKENPPVKP
jgi:hypothetical protein